ncbi:hypothetical protein [Aquirhabdus parva]|uniref:hypothetical protein n=1 Tax=Aquirhabdus TaxID=2824158 RepID=UPI0013B36F5D|nr:hypothetical protein [Aquirhabdus parva]
MIKLHHNPAKHALSHELEALFQQHIVQGGRTRSFRPGESGGKLKFVVGDPKRQGMRV